MNKYKLFLLVSLVAFIASCSAIPKEMPKVIPDRTIISPARPAGSGGKDAWLGIVGKPAANGVEVTDLYVNSPVSQSGIKKGDVIIECDSTKIVDTESLLSAISLKKAGDTIKIKFVRQEETIEIIDSVSKTQTTVSKEEFLRRYQGFREGTNPGDKLEFTVQKKSVVKELTLALISPPKIFHPVAPPEPPKPELRGAKKAGWMGISMGPIKDLTKMGMEKGQGGIKINSVSPSSPAEKGGLKTGDIVIAYDTNTFSGEESGYMDKISEHIKNVGSGGIVPLTILRIVNDINLSINNKNEPIEADKVTDAINNLKTGDLMKTEIVRNIRKLELKITLGTRMMATNKEQSEPEPNDKIHPELADYTIPIEILAKKIISDTGITDKYQDLLKRYSDDEKGADDFRLRDMRYLHRDPFKIPRVCDDLIANVRNSVSNCDNAGLLETISARLDEVISSDAAFLLLPCAIGRPASGGGEDIALMKLKTGISLEEHCQQIEELLKRTEKYRKEAFAGLTDDDILFIKDNIYGLTDRWMRDSNLADPNEVSKRNEIDKKLIQLCGYVNYQKLFVAGKMLTCVLSQEYLDGLKKDIEREGKDKEGILISKDTPFGKIIIAGKGNNKYQENAAIIIDLGGDDFYANRLGGSVMPEQPFSIIIDFEGNDRYSSYEYGCQGAGFMGVGILYDGAGDDIYIAQDWAQGSGLLGIGILVDNNGNDSFKGQEYTQGAGLFGIGILINRAGNDSYQANKSSQGFAGPKAFGLLIDTEGDDNYLASTKHPNGYPDNPGTFDGWSQGCGTGMRAYADPSMSRSGGIGALIDENGADNYEAGTFSQGGGYFFGWGMLCDAGNNNDNYLGTRYAQGFAAHSALGYFIDEGGDDRYKTLCGVVAGLSWDLTCVAFIDKGGNDIYDAGGFSRGATAHNGFCLFMDLGGKDIYKDSVANTAGNTYHGGYSLSVFLDKGPEEDSYPNRINNNIEVNTEYSIFIDTDKEIEDLLKDDNYKGMLKNNIKPKEKTKPND
ncbi:MAG: PDZ domain-containing protein [Planctomycetota bacterium]